MLNLAIGTAEGDGLRNRPGAIGHAIYGPYTQLEPGSYLAEFTIRLINAEEDGENLSCCIVDVVANHGRDVIAWDAVLASQLRNGALVKLGFQLDQAAQVEYRVHVNGRVPLLIANNAVAHAVEPENWPEQGPQTSFMRDHKPMLKRLHDMGVKMAIVGDHMVMEKAGVRFNARVYDDVNFVHELFVINAYNLLFERPTCIIDIGMNVALASLLFATKPFVEEVHAFEPFEATHKRGIANIELNPELALKITVNNFGLGDNVEGDVALNICDSSDSGGMSTLDREGGTLMRIPMRDAATALRPIIDSAKARGLEVIVKIDCEGSEFDVFASLARSDLLKEIRGFMVEWHRVFEGRDQEELVSPLLAGGFIVFDVTPPEGNGFFYAVRAD
jgi:FkbM family methyltransferase